MRFMHSGRVPKLQSLVFILLLNMNTKNKKKHKHCFEKKKVYFTSTGSFPSKVVI